MGRCALLLFAFLLLSGCVSIKPKVGYLCEDGTLASHPALCPHEAPRYRPTPSPEITPAPTATSEPTPGITPTPSPTTTPVPSPSPEPTISPEPTPTPTPVERGFSEVWNRTFEHPVAYAMHVKGIEGDARDYLAVATGTTAYDTWRMSVFDLHSGEKLWDMGIGGCSYLLPPDGTFAILGCMEANKSIEVSLYNITDGSLIWQRALRPYCGTIYQWNEIATSAGMGDLPAVRSFVQFNGIFSRSDGNISLLYGYRCAIHGTYLSALEIRRFSDGALLESRERSLPWENAPASFFPMEYFYIVEAEDSTYFAKNSTAWGFAKDVWDAEATFIELGEDSTLFFSLPAHHNNTFFFRCSVEDDRIWSEKLCAMDVNNGSRKWAWLGNGSIHYTYYGFGEKPFVADGVVGMVTDNSRLVALDEITGELLWEKKVDCQPYPLEGWSTIDPEYEYKCVVKSPAAVGGYVAYAEASRIRAFDLHTGEEIWQMELEPPGGSSISAKGLLVTFAGKSIHVFRPN